MEIVIFTLNGIVIYVLSDWMLRLIERKRGGVMPNRQVVFFVIFLVLVLASFQILRRVLA